MKLALESMLLTQSRLKDYLHYDPETGVWTWLNPLPHSKMKRGDVAGRLTSQGRRQIRIAGGFYYASRLAWLYMTGEHPVDQVDHMNGTKDDDRWVNLREATQSENSFNREWARLRGDRRGIQPHGNQWKVDIGGRYFGLYLFIEEAIVVRDCVLEVMAGNFAQRSTT